jgi:hypothetical protein
LNLRPEPARQLKGAAVTTSVQRFLQPRRHPFLDQQGLYQSR